MFDKGYSVNIELNNLYDMYLVHQGKRNVCEGVKELRKTRMLITKFSYSDELAKRDN